MSYYFPEYDYLADMIITLAQIIPILRVGT